MSRSLRVALTAAAIGLILPRTATAVELVSQQAAVTGINQAFAFDFTSDPDLHLINDQTIVTGMRVDWIFAPGQVPDGGLPLVATLKLSDADTGVGFNAMVPDTNKPFTVSAYTSSSVGLSFSNEVLGALLGNDYGVLEGILNVKSASQFDLKKFFSDGGSLRATLFLATRQGGNPVPEPPAALSFALLFTGAVWLRRFGSRRRNVEEKITKAPVTG